LRKKFKNKNIFLVGGSIRDLFLDIEKRPTDIDLTMAGNPEEIYKKLNKIGLSSWITEKFGTITIIPKEKKK
jgi:tRNA nucleotidyltransferase/poly(A) polymerase